MEAETAMSLMRVLLGWIIGVAAGIGVFIGILAGCVIAFPDWFSALAVVQSLPIGQLTMTDINMLLGNLILIVVLVFAGMGSCILVSMKIGDW